LTASNIKIDITANNSIFKKQDGSNAPSPVSFGDIIKATVVKLDLPKATLYVDDKFSFETDVNKIKSEVALGDELYFEVVKSNNKSVHLKQVAVNTQNQNSKQLSADEMREILKQQGMASDELKPQEDEAQKKADDAIARIKRKINGITDNAAKGAINELVAAGIALERISLDMLNSVMREAEAVNRIKDRGIDGEAIAEEPKTESKDETKSESKSETKSESKSETKNDINEILKTHGLSEDRRNIERLQTVAAKWKEIVDFNDLSLITLLRAGRKLTLDNVYKAKYMIAAEKQAAQDAALPTELDLEIEKFLKHNGFAVDSEHMDISRLLVGADVALTPDNLNKALFLRGIRDFGVDKILELACENIKNGKRASDIEIFTEGQKMSFTSLMNEYDRVIEKLPQVTPSNIEHLYRSGINLTLRNLCAMNFIAKTPPAVSDEAILAKRKLVEIQFKLTHEASVRLANKNININIMPIQEALDTLKEMERQGYEKAFRAMNVPVTESNLNEITELYDKVQTFSPVANRVFGDVITHRVPFTVNGVYGSSVDKQTAPNPKYGDSFSKAEAQLADLLTSLGIEATEENLRAASILSRNNIDVDMPNILRVLNIDAKINSVYDKLHPYIAVDMLRNNLNPANMHLDRVLEYIDTFDGAYGTGVKDKITNYIMDIDNANIIGDITREAMMAVYRMLNMIQRDSSAALGVSLKKDSELTLSNLFNDAKYYQRTKGKKTDMDVKIDDFTSVRVRPLQNDGILNRIKAVLDENNMAATDNNIDMAAEVMNSGAGDQNTALLSQERVSLLLKELSSRANAYAFGEVIEENPGFMDMPLTEITRLLKEKSDLEQRAANAKYTQMINELNDVPPRVIMWLSQNNIPVTINNMTAIVNMLKKPHFIADTLNESEERLSDELSALDEALNNGGSLDDTSPFAEALRQVMETSDNGEALRRVNDIQNVVSAQARLYGRAGNRFFGTPVKLNDRFSHLNMYISKRTSELWEAGAQDENVELYFNIDTANLGNVSMYVATSGEDARIRVCAPDFVSLERLLGASDTLKAYAADAGFNVKELKFEVAPEENILQNEIEASEFEFAV